MAVHPTLRRPLPEFVEQFATWMDRADPQAAVLSAVGYDFRQVAGALRAEPALDTAMLHARARPAFVRQMARLDLDPPSGFWRRLEVERSGEHAGHLDVKHGGIAIVNNLSRVWAVARAWRARTRSAGCARRARPASSTPRSRPLTEAFHFLWDMRLSHEARQVEASEPPDDFVDPAAVGSFTRSGLKAAFRVIERAQRLLGSEESVNPRLP